VSDPIDIKALDEYLKGNSDISRRYRELGSEDVPPELDRRVLDEARAAVASGGGRSRAWLRWGAPVALAASVILAVTVVIESGPQNDTSFVTQPAAVDKARLEPQRQVEESKLQDQVAQERRQERREEQQPAFAAEPPAVTVQQAAPASAPAPAPASVPAAPPPAALAKTELERLNAATLDSPAPQVAAEQPSPGLAGSVATVSARKEVEEAPAEVDSSDDDLSSVSITGTRARRAGRTAGPRGTISGSAISSETRPAADEDAEHSDPEKWLEEIRELRRAGKVEEADRQWQEFGKAFPNFPVATDDLARKQR
jgi:negative regulator of sigma E activity